MGKRVVIKIGSSSLTEDGEIKIKVVKEVCRQVAKLMSQGHEFVIVTSGAVACDPLHHRSKNLRAAVGGPEIESIWNRCFKRYRLRIARILVTDNDLKHHVVKDTIFEAFGEWVIPVLNANDATDSKELMQLERCADNDILCKLVALKIDADIAIYLFDKPGIEDSKGSVIHAVRAQDKTRILRLAQGGNELGHGPNGMRTKMLAGFKLAENGITAYLAPASEKNCIIRVMDGEKDFGTVFLPDQGIAFAG